MWVSNPQIPDHIITLGGETIRWKIITFSWWMQTYGSMTVAHVLNVSKIRQFNVTVHNSTVDNVWSNSNWTGAKQWYYGLHWNIDGTNVYIYRDSGSPFNTSGFEPAQVHLNFWVED